MTLVEVIEEEADEDLRRLAGVGDERITDSVRQIVPARFWWLLVNLLTAILAYRRHQAIRRHHRAHGGAGRADADRRLHGRVTPAPRP